MVQESSQASSTQLGSPFKRNLILEESLQDSRVAPRGVNVAQESYHASSMEKGIQYSLNDSSRLVGTAEKIARASQNREILTRRIHLNASPLEALTTRCFVT